MVIANRHRLIYQAGGHWDITLAKTYSPSLHFELTVNI